MLELNFNSGATLRFNPIKRVNAQTHVLDVSVDTPTYDDLGGVSVHLRRAHVTHDALRALSGELQRWLDLSAKEMSSNPLSCAFELSEIPHLTLEFDPAVDRVRRGLLQGVTLKFSGSGISGALSRACKQVDISAFSKQLLAYLRVEAV